MTDLNNEIFYFFYSFAHQSYFLDHLIIFCAAYLQYLVILSALIFMLFHHDVLASENKLKAFTLRWKEILVIFITSGVAWFVSKILKILIHAERPFLALPDVQSLFSETGFALPSGHASFFMALAVSIFLIHKKAGYVFIVLAVVIGIARIAGGVHFPIDILGGLILGALVAYLVKNV